MSNPRAITVTLPGYLVEHLEQRRKALGLDSISAYLYMRLQEDYQRRQRDAKS